MTLSAAGPAVNWKSMQARLGVCTCSSPVVPLVSLAVRPLCSAIQSYRQNIGLSWLTLQLTWPGSLVGVSQGDFPVRFNKAQPAVVAVDALRVALKVSNIHPHLRPQVAGMYRNPLGKRNIFSSAVCHDVAS